MRQHPSRWDMVNPHRAWFKELSEATQCRSWNNYVDWYEDERYAFNLCLEMGKFDAAFSETDWCLLRQPFRHRWTRWNHVAALQDLSLGTLLDYGCGTGEMMAWLRARRPGWLYAGIDVESPQLAYARRRGFGPPQDYGYDIITCYETLEHLPDPVAAVEEMLWRLWPGGWLLWDFIDDHEGGNVATREARREVLRMLGGTTGQREAYQR